MNYEASSDSVIVSNPAILDDHFHADTDSKLSIEEPAITIFVLAEIVSDNRRAIDFLREFQILAASYKCPKCQSPMRLVKVHQKRTSDQYMWLCGRDNHRIWRSVRKGTWLEQSKLNLKTAIFSTYYFCHKLPEHYACHEVGLSVKSLIDWFRCCREVCSGFLMKRGRIGGPGVSIEVNECYFGDATKSHASGSNTWVFRAVVTDGREKDFVLRVIETRNKANLFGLIRSSVEEGSVIYSDCWNNYGDLEDPEFVNFSVNHRYVLKSYDEYVSGDNVETFWLNVKNGVGRSKRRRGILQSHLDEYVWRTCVDGSSCIFETFLRSVADMHNPISKD